LFGLHVYFFKGQKEKRYNNKPRQTTSAQGVLKEACEKGEYNISTKASEKQNKNILVNYN